MWAGWFHPKKEKYISLDFSFSGMAFSLSPNLSPTGGEALKPSSSFSLLV
ncbi:hypothetical protein COO91_07181 [Nostoc flagelliforme CCNUN1]|uniref:Uncharacterized protein n=1 Tax=Nostoc flagelliforme CCNUN1 TaxID=2038116 RepID=A0A2K8T0B2_9NOSO|nr:hypothetical protein COO91_07181 [Nostoc flagelliforme CCNUN1]